MISSWSTALGRWMQPLRRVVVLGLATVLAFNLAACSGIISQDAKDAARTAVQVAKTAADVTGNDSLKNVLDLFLKVPTTTEKQVKEDDLPAAGKTIQAFQGLWKTAQPVVKLASGSNYGLIEKGVNLVIKTFGGEVAPSKDNALTALGGLIGPLTKLLT